MSYDIVIKNGKIIDGTGNPWMNADIGINDGKITKLGRRTVDYHLEDLKATNYERAGR